VSPPEYLADLRDGRPRGPREHQQETIKEFLTGLNFRALVCSSRRTTQEASLPRS